MKHSKMQTRPYAVIALDADTFHVLSRPVPAAFKRSDTALTTYLDLLPLLAEHGIRIEIPETVSLEIARVLADGRHVNVLFDNAKQPNMKELTFLQAVAAGTYPDIQIVSKTGPAQADAYCAALHQALDGYEEALAKGTPAATAAVSARDDIISAQRGLNKEQIGDESLLSLTHSIKGRVTSKKAFVLSEDKDIGHQLDKVSRLRFRTFMHALVSSGIATQAGIKPGIGADAIALDVCRQRHPEPEEFAKYSQEFNGKPTAEMLIDMRQRCGHFLTALTLAKEEMVVSRAPADERDAMLAKYGANTGQSVQRRG